ncbi:MAG: Uncharacterized DUF554 membrane protein, partial [uncultured Solirubrobacteraceae bacterium]
DRDPDQRLDRPDRHRHRHDRRGAPVSGPPAARDGGAGDDHARHRRRPGPGLGRRGHDPPHTALRARRHPARRRHRRAHRHRAPARGLRPARAVAPGGEGQRVAGGRGLRRRLAAVLRRLPGRHRVHPGRPDRGLLDAGHQGRARRLRGDRAGRRARLGRRPVGAVHPPRAGHDHARGGDLRRPPAGRGAGGADQRRRRDHHRHRAQAARSRRCEGGQLPAGARDRSGAGRHRPAARRRL